MKSIVLINKEIPSLLLALIPNAELGFIKAYKKQGKILTDIQVRYYSDFQKDVDEIIYKFNKGKTINTNGRVLMNKYKYVDLVVRKKVRDFK